MLTEEQKQQWATGWDYRLINEDEYWLDYLPKPVEPTTLPILVFLTVIAIFDRELEYLLF
ncbi:MAG: hypothetical protein ACKN9E_10005 [Microcystaceae cyanobacterium]